MKLGTRNNVVRWLVRNGSKLVTDTADGVKIGSGLVKSDGSVTVVGSVADIDDILVNELLAYCTDLAEDVNKQDYLIARLNDRLTEAK